MLEKIIKKTASVFLAFLMTITSLLSFSIAASAASVYVRPRKSVYLVMDDSGSMNDYGRENDANYALQTFLATLDKDDEVNLYFLNKKKVYGETDISNKSNSFIEEIRSNYPDSRGGTPFDAVEDAAKDLQKAVKEDSEREYWLVVITDGGFDSAHNAQNYLDTFSNTQLKNGYYPNFLYVGVGGGETLTVPEGAENRFFLDSDTNIINAMENAILHITNRQVIVAEDSSADSLEFDLPYPARNIVILAQNQKTKIVSANSASDLKLDEIYEVQYPVTNSDLQNTTVCYITEKNGSSISAGHIELTFDTSISANDAIIMVEPAIGISAKYFDEGGMEINPQDMRKGQTLTVEMSVCDSETNAPIPTTDLFGDIKQYISVNGTTYDGKKVTFTVPDTEINIEMVAEFSDGLVLDIYSEYENLEEVRTLSLFVSDSGKFKADEENIDSAEGIVVTPLINGTKLSEEDFKASKLNIKDENIFHHNIDVDKDYDTCTYIIHPKAGIGKLFTPNEEQIYEIEFSTGEGETLTDVIGVTVNVKINWVDIGIRILITLLVLYLIFVELTRKRFPAGAYVKYFAVNSDGSPANYLTDRIFLNRPSWEKLKNGSYLPIPFCKYKVKGICSCDDITIVASGNSSFAVEGVKDIEKEDDYGYRTETTTYVQIDKDGNELAFKAPIKDRSETTMLMIPFGRYIRKHDMKKCIRLSTRKYDKETNHHEV